MPDHLTDTNPSRFAGWDPLLLGKPSKGDRRPKTTSRSGLAALCKGTTFNVSQQENLFSTVPYTEPFLKGNRWGKEGSKGSSVTTAPWQSDSGICHSPTPPPPPPQKSPDVVLLTFMVGREQQIMKTHPTCIPSWTLVPCICY